MMYTSRQVVRFVGLKSSDIKNKVHGLIYAYAEIVGFAIPELYQLAETHDVHYVIRLKANHLLKQTAQKLEDKLWKRFGLNTTEAKVFYRSFDYKARAWDQSRRVVVKMEKPEGELFFTYTFIVVNMQLSPINIVKLYIYATKLQLLVLAYNFNNWFRRLCLTGTIRKNRIDNIRLKLLKIAGKLVRSGRYLRFKLCSSCLYQKVYWQTLQAIHHLPRFG